MNKPETLNNKIEWLIYNKGCKTADGYSGLCSFFAYCCTMKDEKAILKIIEPMVEDAFDCAWADHEDEMEYRRTQEERCQPENIADEIWSSLCDNLGGYEHKGMCLSELEGNDLDSLIEDWIKLIRRHK